MQNERDFFVKFFKEVALSTTNNANATDHYMANDTQFVQDMLAVADFCNKCLEQLQQDPNADICTMFAEASCDVEFLLEVLEEDYERPDLALFICTEVDGRKVSA